MIHETAIVHPEARLGKNISIGAYSIVEKDVRLEDDVTLAEHVIVRSGTSVGKGSRVDSFSVLGGLPQDKSFDPATPTFVRIGEGCVLREGVTVHRSTEKGEATEVGDHCFLMGHAHVGHDCKVKRDVTIANAALLAGFVSVGSHTFIGGGAKVHQFVNIGESVMISGYGAFSQHIAPFVMAMGRNQLVGLNLIGLKRRGFSSDMIRDLKRCYQTVFSTEIGALKDKAASAQDAGLAGTEAGKQFLSFFSEQQDARGFVQPNKRNA